MVAASTGFSKACALLLENGANVFSVDQNGRQNIQISIDFFFLFTLDMTVLHHAIDSKNFDTIAVIAKHLHTETDEAVKISEINKQVGVHKWTPLYRAG